MNMVEDEGLSFPGGEELYGDPVAEKLIDRLHCTVISADGDSWAVTVVAPDMQDLLYQAYGYMWACLGITDYAVGDDPRAVRIMTEYIISALEDGRFLSLTTLVYMPGTDGVPTFTEEFTDADYGGLIDLAARLQAGDIPWESHDTDA